MDFNKSIQTSSCNKLSQSASSSQAIIQKMAVHELAHIPKPYQLAAVIMKYESRNTASKSKWSCDCTFFPQHRIEKKVQEVWWG